MKEALISLLEQLPSVLNGSHNATTILSIEDQVQQFRSPTPLFQWTYVIDYLNTLIIDYLQHQWYTTPDLVVDLPKVPWPDLILDTKKLYELNRTKTNDFKSFVNFLFEQIVLLSNISDYAIFEQQWIFINIKVTSTYLSEHHGQVMKHKSTYGTINYPPYTGKKLLMEYSSPNMAKSMTIGHFRNSIIGQIVYNMIQQTGCEHFNRNYIGDRWTAFGKFVVVLQYQFQKDPTIIEHIVWNPQAYMGVLYAQYKDCPLPNKDEFAKQIVSLMERNNEVIIQLWKIIRKLSLIDFEVVYHILNIHFDCTLGESFAVTLDNNVLQDLLERDIVHESQWAMIIKLKRTGHGLRQPLTSKELDAREEWVDQVLMFAKSDGSTLYAPRDLALLKYRSQSLRVDKLIYVVWSEQSVYFEHLISLGQFLGRIQPWSTIHLGYGLYLQNGKKMSSRAGGTLGAMGLIEDITQAVLHQSEWRIDYSIAQKLAISALIINDTKGDINKDVNLDIPSMTKLSGDTGIYIQYTAVRLQSLIEKLWEMNNLKFDTTPYKLDCASLSAHEASLLFQTSLLATKLRHSLELCKPHILTQYLLELAGWLNKWYNDSPKVLEMSEDRRLLLYQWLTTCATVFEKVMRILHMPHIDKM